MERALKNSIYIILLSLLMFNCKTDKKKPVTNEAKQLLSKSTNTIKTVKYDKFRKESLNCLKESDTLEIKRFRKQLANAIIQKDTLTIMNFVQDKYMDKSITLENKKKEIDFETIMELCLKEVMPEYALDDLEGAESFNEKEGFEGCFIYKITNNFTNRELAHIFIFEKIDGYIKLVEIQTIG
ncbi:MAG: hypothetical protein L3J10_10495 [Sulfurimonas sp.]|nr:hypothetical protein [Sulfurimonas sp.]